MNALGYFRLGRRRQVKHSVEARMRLVLFGFAGGTVTALHSLAEAFPSWIEVWGAEYPGRGMRWRETPKTTVHALLDDLSAGLHMLDDMPLAMLGYSMGAHLAYRLALAARPQHLAAFIAISARPPIHRVDQWESQNLSDQHLIDKLEGLGGIPFEILNNPSILQDFLPVMRADLAVCADFNHFKVKRLPCEMLVLEGTEDRLLLNAQAHRWLELAGGEEGASRHRLLSGGHFFHKGREPEIAEDISVWLGHRLGARSSALTFSSTQDSNNRSNAIVNE